MTTKIPHTVFNQIVQTKSSPETIAALLNEAENKYSDTPKHWNAKRLYPFWKPCQKCGNPFLCLTKEQVVRNKTCSPECRNALIGQKNSRKQPLSKRKGEFVTCAVCNKQVWKPLAWLKRTEKPTCSRECNGVLRGAEWKESAKLGRQNWKPESEAALVERMTGETNPSWKGGITYGKRKGKYQNYKIKYVKCPQEFLGMARKDGYVMEHRLKVAVAINRPLKRSEAVHHIDHNPENNNLNNLMLFRTNREHKMYEGGNTDIKPLWPL